MLDDGRIKTASYDASEGFGLRAVKGEVAGYAHATEISERALRRPLRDGAPCRGRWRRHDGRPAQGRERGSFTHDADPMGDTTFPVKIDLLREIDAYARRRTRGSCRSLPPSPPDSTVEILRADAAPVRYPTDGADERLRHGRRERAARVGRHGRRRRVWPGPPDGAAHWQAPGGRGPADCGGQSWRLGAPAGAMDVLLGPGWPGILLHEAMGHGLEGDFNRKKTSAFAGLWASGWPRQA